MLLTEEDRALRLHDRSIDAVIEGSGRSVHCVSGAVGRGGWIQNGDDVLAHPDQKRRWTSRTSDGARFWHTQEHTLCHHLVG